MTPDERQALIEAGALESEIDAQLETVDETVEHLARLSIESEERHDEIVEGLSQCRNRLESLSTQIQTPSENPIQTQILRELSETRSELVSLKSMVESLLSNPPQSVSVATPPVAEPQTVALTVEPEPDVPREVEPPPIPRRKRRIF